jgi:hypothetical protein
MAISIDRTSMPAEAATADAEAIADDVIALEVIDVEEEEEEEEEEVEEMDEDGREEIVDVEPVVVEREFVIVDVVDIDEEVDEMISSGASYRINSRTGSVSRKRIRSASERAEIPQEGLP